MKELRNQNKSSRRMTREEAEQQITESDLKKVESVTSRYKNKSSNEMFGDIMKMIQEGEQNGTLRKQDIQEFANRISPMLDSEQKSKLKLLLNSIK